MRFLLAVLFDGRFGLRVGKHSDRNPYAFITLTLASELVDGDETKSNFIGVVTNLQLARRFDTTTSSSLDAAFDPSSPEVFP